MSLPSLQNKPRRLINWWLSWEDLNRPNADTHERIKQRAYAAAEANVTTAILFGAHFRWDYLPYFTILHDHIATVAEELHAYGIELFDRHSVNLIHRYDTREEMRHVMLDSGPHLPFSPSREAAATWEYKGKRLNDWRMIDVRTRAPLYYPQYAGEGFCYRNPDFIEAYCDYAARLVRETGIDGLAAEDPVHYMHYISCACPHCRAELRRRTGRDLPAIEDRGFWGNWDNPAWRAWIDLRYAAGQEFFERLSACLPKDFPLTTCGQNSASPTSNGSACDCARFVAGGSNYIHMEMSGNTPPYYKDPVTANVAIADRAVGFSHHSAIAKENAMRSFSTGYGFSAPSAHIIWALNKLLDVDCCFSTLKARLGLPDHILRALPDEAELVSRYYTFEKEHPELFGGVQMASVGVFFSYETRNNTYFGNLGRGYYRDYAATLRTLFRAGIGAHTLLRIPRDTAEYAVVILPSVVRLTEEEQAALSAYRAAGGILLVLGPTALSACGDPRRLPSHPTIGEPGAFFSTIVNGVWHRSAEWILSDDIAPTEGPTAWRQVETGLYYHPYRVSEGACAAALLSEVRRHLPPSPVEVCFSEGYLTTLFAREGGYVLHLLAESYDTDIDHEKDEMRTHRSRVNLVNRVTPIHVSARVAVKAPCPPQVFIPDKDEAATVAAEGDGYTVTLPEGTAYAILYFPKN